MLKQSLQQKLLQKLSPQQIQLMKLLQVPTLELEARIKQELEANPALEEGAEKEEVLDEFDGQEQETSEALEDFDFDEYLDDDGYLRRDLDSIVNDLAFTQGIDVPREALDEALVVVQSLDPAGVGARDLQECLKLQVERKQADKIARKLKDALADLDEAARLQDGSRLQRSYSALAASFDAYSEVIPAEAFS